MAGMVRASVTECYRSAGPSCSRPASSRRWPLPRGISGAVLLRPFQVSVLATPSPSVTPANLLYNVVATPGALYRYWR